MKDGKLQIGIIGCGGIAKQKHLPALSKLGDMCNIVAFCDVKEDRASELAKSYGAPKARVYTDYGKLLDDSSIDVVHVLTPNVSHGPITVAALEAGKHVMCEKPMAHNSTDAAGMVAAAKKAGKKLTIGYQNRFRNDVQVLHKACRAGMLGDIYFGKAHAVRRRAVPTWGVFQDKAQQGGGPLIDIGTHALDITLWAMDNYAPASVTGSVFYKMADKVDGNLFGPWDPKTYDVEDSAFGFIKMKNGATIYLEASWVLNTTDVRESATSLCGTEGGAEMRGGAGSKLELVFNSARYGNLFEEKISSGGDVAYFEGAAMSPGDQEAHQWLSAIMKNTEPLVKPEQAFVVTQILEAIYASHQTGKMIQL
ncbi:MAG: Gfo/Idh/MocA family oxidoreductase [Spirochaetia bacterium]|jgi:predicted dehydrogenase